MSSDISYLDMKTHSLVIVPLVYALMYGFLKVLLPKPLKNRTKTGPGPVSGLGPVRFGPDPQVFSPVRSVTPGTLVLYQVIDEYNDEFQQK